VEEETGEGSMEEGRMEWATGEEGEAESWTCAREVVVGGEGEGFFGWPVWLLTQCRRC
jgi:hypothetical protein